MKKLQFITSIVFLIFCGWLWTRTSEAPYNTKHWYKPHRWYSEELKTKEAQAKYLKCMQLPRGEPVFCSPPTASNFATVYMGDKGSYEFDICLEHGELRRIEPPK